MMSSKLDVSNLDKNWNWDMEVMSEQMQPKHKRKWRYTIKTLRQLKSFLRSEIFFDNFILQSETSEVSIKYTKIAFTDCLNERMERYNLSKKDAMLSLLKTFKCSNDIEKFCRKFGFGLPKEYIDLIKEIVV